MPMNRGGAPPNQPQTAAPAPGSRTPWLRGLLIGMALTVVIAVAAVLAWRSAGSAPLRPEQWAVYALLLGMAAVGPVLMALMLQRLGDIAPRAVAPAWLGWLSPAIGSAALLSLGIVAAALLTYRAAADRVDRDVEQRLHTVASLKQQLLQRWIGERLDDMRISVESPTLSDALRAWRAAPQPNSPARQRLLDYLTRFAQTSHYVEVSVRDGNTGAILLATTSETDSAVARRAAVSAAAASEPLLEDFHFDSERSNVRVLELGAFAALRVADVATPYVFHVTIDPKH
jgi:hypothetical protein